MSTPPTAPATGLSTDSARARIEDFRGRAMEFIERAAYMLAELDYVVQLLPAPGWHVVHGHGTDNPYAEQLVGWALLNSGETQAVVHDPESTGGYTDVLWPGLSRDHKSVVVSDADLAAAMAYRGPHPREFDVDD